MTIPTVRVPQQQHAWLYCVTRSVSLVLFLLSGTVDTTTIHPGPWESLVHRNPRHYRRRDRLGHTGHSQRGPLQDLNCYFYEQPLNHFDLPRNKSGTFQQRYCISNQFVRTKKNVAYNSNLSHSQTSSRSKDPYHDQHDDNWATTAPIFFYTGNESPLEEYIEHTGLLWEMAQEFGAQVVFAEHRYEGQSVPKPTTMPACMAYSSSVQAISDYARIIRNVLWRPLGKDSPSVFNKDSQKDGDQSDKHSDDVIVPRPVICFGGSYGGMLSAWIRMRYPQWVAGAIAASAPIWGFPLQSSKRPASQSREDNSNRNSDAEHPRMDAASAIIRHGLSLPYPPNRTKIAKGEENHCPNNMLASFPLIHILGQNNQTDEGLEFLTHTFGLCPGTLSDTNLLVAWLQTPWFDLAEASFPYPSAYVPYALNHLNISLPAWPLQAACWKTGLAQDYGIAMQGSLTNVTYNISFPAILSSSGDSGYTIQVDWDDAHSNTPISDWVTHPSVSSLLSSMRNAVSIWYNMTHNVSCYDISQAAPNAVGTAVFDMSPTAGPLSTDNAHGGDSALRYAKPTMAQEGEVSTTRASISLTDSCQDRMQTGSWPALCCNEDMNLIITLSHGVGQDVFWPPAVPRTVQSYSDYVEFYGDNLKDPFCDDPDGKFGFPSQPDPWSNWLDLQYRSYNVLETASNILFSNGLLDPWSAAGVFVRDSFNSTSTTSHRLISGLTLQKHKRGLASLLLDYGGHHVDLMYSDAQYDHPSFEAARMIERRYVASWIQEFWNNTSSATTTTPGSGYIRNDQGDWSTAA